jgi:uncharacterized Zn finger protein
MKLKCPKCGSENVRKAKIGNEQRDAKSTYKCMDCKRFFYSRPERPEKPRPITTKQHKEEIDPSINNPDDYQENGESDLEEDAGLLEESDYGW